MYGNEATGSIKLFISLNFIYIISNIDVMILITDFMITMTFLKANLLLFYSKNILKIFKTDKTIGSFPTSYY